MIIRAISFVSNVAKFNTGHTKTEHRIYNAENRRQNTLTMKRKSLCWMLIIILTVVFELQNGTSDIDAYIW